MVFQYLACQRSGMPILFPVSLGSEDEDETRMRKIRMTKYWRVKHYKVMNKWFDCILCWRSFRVPGKSLTQFLPLGDVSLWIQTTTSQLLRS